MVDFITFTLIECDMYLCELCMNGNICAFHLFLLNLLVLATWGQTFSRMKSKMAEQLNGLLIINSNIKLNDINIFRLI